MPTPTVRFASVLALLSVAVSTRGEPVFAADPPPPAAPVPPKEPTGPHPLTAEATFGDTRVQRPDGTAMYFYRTNYMKAQELVTTVTTLLKFPGILLYAYPRANQVILDGKPDDIEAVLDVFAYFDVADPQVFVEAKIVEVTYDNNFEFGFSSVLDRDVAGPNTFWRGGTTTLNPPSFFQSQQPGNLPFQGLGLAFGLVGAAAEKYGALDLSLQAAQSSGTAEILSRPSIVATEGVPASVKTTQKTPIIQITNAQSNPAGDTLILATTYIDTAIGLEVLPIHIGDGYVKLDVAPTVSTVTGFALGQGGTTAPIISTRNAKTTITMADGETLVIGGLYTDSTLKDTAKVPFLGDIPCLGALFTRTRDQKVKTELLFFITPHILRKKTDYKVIAPPGEKERLENVCPPGAPAR